MDMKNNKGYMLVEIILAFAIAFSVAVTLLNLTIKLKNKNDDMLVEGQIETDRVIISNKLYKYVKLKKDSFDCDKLSLNVDKKAIYYDGVFIDCLNDYVEVNNNSLSCDDSDKNRRLIRIHTEIPQLKNKKYDINVDYVFPDEEMVNINAG